MRLQVGKENMLQPGMKVLVLGERKEEGIGTKLCSYALMSDRLLTAVSMPGCERHLSVSSCSQIQMELLQFLKSHLYLAGALSQGCFQLL